VKRRVSIDLETVTTGGFVTHAVLDIETIDATLPVQGSARSIGSRAMWLVAKYKVSQGSVRGEASFPSHDGSNASIGR